MNKTNHNKLFPITHVLSTENEWSDNYTSELKCPVCGYDYQDFSTPKIVSDEEAWKANWKGRGSLLIIPMEGECGSQWQICIGFHKGKSKIFTQLVQACKTDNGYVYFIEALGLNKIKIGFSDNPERRISQLTTGSPVPLKLITKIPGSIQLERELQARFEPIRFDKEWFYATKELMAFIASLNSET